MRFSDLSLELENSTQTKYQDLSPRFNIYLKKGTPRAAQADTLRSAVTAANANGAERESWKIPETQDLPNPSRQWKQTVQTVVRPLRTG